MLKNHFKISFRNLWKNKTLSLLNLIGLSIGISSVLTLFFSVYAYYTADDFISDKDNVYYFKTYFKDGTNFREIPYPFLDQLLANSTETTSGTQLHGWGDMWLAHEDKDFQYRTDYANPKFLEVFGLQLKYGNPETALKDKYSVVLTDKVSQQMFGTTNPVGKTIVGADTLNLRVTGVLKPISPYSSFRLGILLPNTLLENNDNFISQNNWENSFSPLFVKLRNNGDLQKLNAEATRLLKENHPNSEQIDEVKLMPFSEMRTDAIPIVDVIINGSIVASLFILFIILVNLLNLNTSTMLGRVKTNSVRKVLGSAKSQLIAQYCIENGILIFAAILLSLYLFYTVNLPRLNDTFGPEFGRISFNVWDDYPVIIGIAVIGILSTLLVSILPSLRFMGVPVNLGIIGKVNLVKRNFLLRNSFIILQFTIAVLCICVALVLTQQISYMKNADLGFERDNILVGNIDLDYKNNDVAQSKFNSLLNDLSANPYVQSVSTSQSVPSDYFFNYTNFYEPILNKDVRIRTSYADDSYFETLKIPLVGGRYFNETIDKETDNRAIINEAALRAFGWSDIEGKSLKYKDGNGSGFKVVGVVSDFHYQDLQKAVEPLVHFYRQTNNLDRHRYLTVRVQEGHEAKIESLISSAFQNIDTRKPYLPNRLKDKVSGQYLLIEGILQSVSITALLAIFISCLGLFGLISFSAKQKVKEIGIRKVLGASVAKIVILLSKNYLIMVGIAALIAFPTAWYVMSSWLEGFAYRIDIKWWMFALAGLITIVITGITLSFKTIKSALANPVKSLKTE